MNKNIIKPLTEGSTRGIQKGLSAQKLSSNANKPTKAPPAPQPQSSGKGSKEK